MSWTLSIPATAKADFNNAVDKAQPSGTPAPAADVAKAKASLKKLAQSHTEANLTGQASDRDLVGTVTGS